jgi:uncharacterized protein (DUF1697 family)
MSVRKAPTARGTSGAHAALLRGINVGGKNMLPMRDLAQMFAAAGCGDVRTYIQSGNVVFTAPADVVARLAADIAKRIETGFGIRVPVVLRSADELARVAMCNPFLGRDADTDALHVMFLADAPSAGAVAGLDARRSPPDEFAVVGRDVYLRCPNGVAKTKLTNAYFDSKLGTTSTARNWRTVQKLVELTRG